MTLNPIQGRGQEISYSYKFFGGLNKRDDPLQLQQGQTSQAKNNEVLLASGLANKRGIEDLFPGQLQNIHWDGLFYFENAREEPSYIGVSYPNIYLIDNQSGFPEKIYSEWFSSGEPFLVQSTFGECLMVDGANPPVHIKDKVAQALAWPPNYTNSNKTELAESPYAQEDNPTTLGGDIGYPSLGVFNEGRYVLSGDNIAPTRLYASKIGSLDFEDNSGSGIDIPFFLNLFSNSPITGLEVISNQYLVIFCKNEIFLWSGVYAPRVNAPQPTIQVKPLDREIGCIGKRAFAKSNSSDIFFLASNKALYSLASSQNFQDTRPLGLSELIFPDLESFKCSTLERTILVNDKVKGELQLWLPESDDKFYPNTRYVYSYAETKNEPEWSFDKGLNVDAHSVFVDKDRNSVIVGDISKYLVSDSGVAYNGNDIALEYRLAPLDFGDRDVTKKITDIIVYYRLIAEGDVNLVLTLKWDNSLTGLPITFTLKPSIQATFGTAIYGDPQYKYGFSGGVPINTESKEVAAGEGQVLQCLLQASGKFDLFISEVRFRGYYTNRPTL